ncbi:MAG: polyamine aminopropyltransferase [Pseudomonadales bacterium]|nr:polyamine aminopropyltransferase [Pseudomonadales bacterium]MCP5331968.1 polyamine aminopropyltransferase [Pseudomonadales bacterium]HNI65500.1 polyamine aminopropyltransferase [Pseudomonadales bacterium]
MSNGDAWVIERFGDEGSAIGLAVEAKLHEEQSEFQKIEIYQSRSYGKVMLIDGCFMLSERDHFIYHEMITHPALFSHPAPRRVAIIGGGDCGTLTEVLKHRGVEQAWQIEIDERVTRVSEQYFPELCGSNGDPRAQLLFADGIAWMRERPADSLDVIIIDSTDPVGPAAGLFHPDFYRDCHRALGAQGVLVQQSESPLFHAGSIIRGVHDGLAQVGFSSRRTLTFPLTIYPSGWWSVTLGGQGVTLAETGPARFDELGIDTRYYTPQIHQAAGVLPRFVREALAQ